MREIKFRAWDDFQKKYVCEGFHVIGEITCFDGIGQIIHETWKERSERLEYKSSLLAFNDFTLEQYTNVLDKNRKEIYEGDIVKTDELGWIGKCVYNYDGFMLIDNNGGFSSPSWKECEVIGNIHENPELMA